VASVIKTKKYRLKDSFKYHDQENIIHRKEIDQGIKRKGDFHLFHTIEFHTLIGILGIFWSGFFYIFIGMIFHSLLDVIDLIRCRAFHRREYFFFNWWRRKRKSRKS